MKKSSAILAFSLFTLASATASACPTGSPLMTAAFITVFTAAFWLPLSLITSLVLFFLRKRFGSRRALVVSMLGSVPFSLAAVLGMLFVSTTLFRPALGQQTLIFAATAGCVTALNAGYVALCHHFGRKDG